MQPEPLTGEQLNLLREHAQQREDGRWVFESSLFPHPAYEALDIIEACLLLDVPVNDPLPARTWLLLVRRVVELERTVARIIPERAVAVPAAAVPSPERAR